MLENMEPRKEGEKLEKRRRLKAQLSKLGWFGPRPIP
jgi:exonuclease VII large subunit